MTISSRDQMYSSDQRAANDWWLAPSAPLDRAAEAAARERQAQLTKPAGSLGRLEEIAIRLAAMQGTAQPSVQQPLITVFAADHGVVEEGVSLYPTEVTAEMVRNFSRGGAAISVLAQLQGVRLQVINVGTKTPLEALPGVLDRRIASGTANFAKQPAMTAEQLRQALAVGREAVAELDPAQRPLFIGGEMGIGNTTAASALACALLKAPAALLTGPGTGLQPAGVSHKARVIEQALQRHALHPDEPLRCLQAVGGFEIAALCGAYLSCAQRGIPVLVDGFICAAAALAALRLQPDIRDWLLFAHTSAEPGFRVLMEALEVRPLLHLDMRLGEGSGAAVALALIQQACALHNRMATFAEAAVSTAASATKPG